MPIGGGGGGGVSYTEVSQFAAGNNFALTLDGATRDYALPAEAAKASLAWIRFIAYHSLPANPATLDAGTAVQFRIDTVQTSYFSGGMHGVVANHDSGFNAAYRAAGAGYTQWGSFGQDVYALMDLLLPATNGKIHVAATDLSVSLPGTTLSGLLLGFFA